MYHLEVHPILGEQLPKEITQEPASMRQEVQVSKDLKSVLQIL